MLVESIRGAARRFGDRPALIAASGTPLTFAALDRWSDRLTVALTEAHGVAEGAVVALTLPSDPSYVACYLALAKLGAITAGVNPRLASPERDAVVKRLAPDVVIEDVSSLGLASEDAAPPPPLPADPDRIVAIVCTSGTTGQPKGAVFANRQLAAACTLDVGGLDVWDGGGPMLASTQFPHVGFMTKLPWWLRTGATLLFQERWRAAAALRLVAEHRVASIGGVSAQMGLLLRVPDFDRYDLSCVRTIVMGGGPSPPALVREARERFNAAYSIRYSSTESGGVGTGTAFDADDEEALYTVGRPKPGVEVRLDQATGEVLLRSPAVMSGYWRDPALTATTLDADGWLRTGDLGELDDRGCLRLVGRTTDMYIRGGYNVHPQEVEAVLQAHPDVVDVAVVPRPDPVMGEIGVAVVVPAGDGPTLEELRSFAAGRLAGYKLPEAIRVVDALPLTTMDKLDRRALVDQEVRAGGR